MKPGYKQTEVGVIPKDWTLNPLSKLSAFITKGSTPTTYGFKWEMSGILFLRSECVSECGLDLAQAMFISSEANTLLRRSEVVDGDILMTITGYVGRVVLLSGVGHANVNQHIARIRINSPNADAEFVFHALSQPSARRRFNLITTGQAYPQISLKQVREADIPLPPTVAEQRAIASALGDADGLIESLERLIAKKRAIKQGTMQELLTGRRRLPGFKGEWEQVEFGNVATIRNEKVMASSMPEETPCIELESIGSGTGRLTETMNATGVSSKYRFMKGDVLFGRLRSYLKKYWFAAFNGICSTEIWPIIPRGGRLRSEYLHLIVQTNGFTDAAGVSYGTHMPRSDWSIIRKYGIQLPRIDEQTAIASVLAGMDAEIAALEGKLAKARAIKQGMMQELLTGRIRLA